MKKINRRRTRDPKHFSSELKSQKMKLYKECETVLPLLADDTYNDIADPVIASSLIDRSPSPEAEMISKDLFKMFSDEARELVQTILSCPEEFFLINGRIKKSLLRRTCKETLGWSKNKTDSTIFEIGLRLQCAMS